jgi:predicted nucleotidyltransferase
MNIIEREKQINKRLIEDYKYVKSLGYNILGVFVQGSDNYSLSWAGSDIDTKVIVVPSFEDFVLNKKPTSTTLILPSNEHIDLKDIRLMHECFRKQNINFIEILFTKYKYLNPEYIDLYQPMFDNNEKIAHYNNYAAVNCIAGMVYEKHKAMEHPYPTLIDKIEKYGYDNKQLHHIIRCEEFLNRYIAGVPYAECLIPTNPQYLINVKSEYIHSLEEARQIADNSEYLVKLTKQEYIDTHPVVIDSEVDKIMNNVLFEVLKHSFKEEINK